MTDQQSLIKFPCYFPVKVIGKKTTSFVTDMQQITQKHFPDTLDEAIVLQESRQGNYLSLTITVYVHNQQSLDDFYLELTQHPDIKMVL